MKNILEEIAARTRERIAKEKSCISVSELENRIQEVNKNARQKITFLQALQKDGMSYICEVKKASPSKGLIAPDFPYLAIAKEYEPLLLLPIAFGCIMANFPNTGFEDEMGVMMAIGFGIKYEIFPPLIFMGVGAMTDFGPLIANPKTMLLGAAAQIGVFVALAGAMLLGFNVQEAASIGIIGGADGPTAIYLTSKLAPHLLGAIAVAAYSYMSLVPLIQPPIMKMFTTKEQRKIKMVNLRPVTRFEKVVFPIVVAIVVSLASASGSGTDGLPVPWAT